MDKNTKLLLSVLVVAFGMVGLAFASVPLYNLFCRTTGFGGTTQVSNAAPSEDEIINRAISVHFSSNVARHLPWTFKAEKNKMTVNVGQQGFISFKATSKTDHDTSGTAVYNVSPPKAGKYFQKTQCFCFDQQTLEAGQEVDMPVVFYIDPSIVKDRNMDDVQTITLSYSFYPADSKELDTAIEAFYNTP